MTDDAKCDTEIRRHIQIMNIVFLKVRKKEAASFC